MKRRANGEGSVSKRKDGRWHARVTMLGGKRLSVYGQTRAEAVRKLNTAKSDLEVGTLASPSAQTLGEWLDYWLDNMQRQVVAASTSVERLNVVLFALFGVLALFLVSVGVYGVMSCLVSERIREIGIRMALGARPGAVLRSVLGQGLILALVGIAIGVLGALGVGRALSGLLFGVSWYDPATLSAIPIVVLGVSLVACYFPARRATRVDPVDVLRHH